MQLFLLVDQFGEYCWLGGLVCCVHSNTRILKECGPPLGEFKDGEGGLVAQWFSKPATWCHPDSEAQERQPQQQAAKDDNGFFVSTPSIPLLYFLMVGGTELQGDFSFCCPLALILCILCTHFFTVSLACTCISHLLLTLLRPNLNLVTLSWSLQLALVCTWPQALSSRHTPATASLPLVAFSGTGLLHHQACTTMDVSNLFLSSSLSVVDAHVLFAQVSAALTFPIDTLKTRLQAGKPGIPEKKGLRGLYKGMQRKGKSKMGWDLDKSVCKACLLLESVVKICKVQIAHNMHQLLSAFVLTLHVGWCRLVILSHSGEYASKKVGYEHTFQKKTAEVGRLLPKQQTMVGPTAIRIFNSKGHTGQKGPLQGIFRIMKNQRGKVVSDMPKPPGIPSQNSVWNRGQIFFTPLWQGWAVCVSQSVHASFMMYP